MITSFLVGAVTGAAVMWVYGGQIREYIDDRTRKVRERTANTLHSVARTVDEGLSGHGRARSA